MSNYKYKKIDAFTASTSLGNSAACIFLQSSQSLSEEEMLDIAKQHKGFVSEVVYCIENNDSISLTYYSSECEVDFCGHGTIACMYSLIKDNPKFLNKDEIIIHTNKKGMLTVYNKILKQDAVFITAPKPLYIDTTLSIKDIAYNLEIETNIISTNYPVDIIDAGLRTLIVPIKNINDEISIFPNEKKLKEFCLSNDIDIVLIYSFEVNDFNNKAHTRVFAPKFGYLEDPATGSGNSAFGYYMLKNKLWNGKVCSIEQGGNDRVFNIIQLSLLDDVVLFGGSATTRIDGVYYVDDK